MITHSFSLAGSMTPYLLVEISMDDDGYAVVKAAVDGELHSVKCQQLRHKLEEYGIHYEDAHIIQMRPRNTNKDMSLVNSEEKIPETHVQILDFSHPSRNRAYGFSIDVQSTALMSLLGLAYVSKNLDPKKIGPHTNGNGS